MKFDFVPKVCRGENPTYTGKVVINVPKAPERFNYLRESGVLAIYEKMADDKGKEKEELRFDLSSQFELVGKMMGFVEKHVKEVDLTRVEDGFKVSDVDTFLSVNSLESAVMEVCLLFIKGFEPGKNSGA